MIHAYGVAEPTASPPHQVWDYTNVWICLLAWHNNNLNQCCAAASSLRNTGRELLRRGGGVLDGAELIGKPGVEFDRGRNPRKQ